MREEIAQHNPEILFMDGFDGALIGVIYRSGQNPIACYDIDECVKILEKQMSHLEAQEYFEFNMLGSRMGENTPCFLDRCLK